MIKIDWRMFIHHRVFFGFFVEIDYDTNKFRRLVWQWDWASQEMFRDKVPWHRCYYWASGPKHIRMLGWNPNGGHATELWKVND